MADREQGGIKPSVVLASASAARARLLRASGVDFIQEAVRIDEESLKASMRAAGADAAAMALKLAELKAMRGTRRHGDTLVIGADQTMSADGEQFDKPADVEAARHQLAALRGRRHTLHTAVVVAKDGARIWHNAAAAHLTMREFSDAFLDWYLAEAGERVLDSVGCYQLEGLGAQLFERVEGDYFTILGLPLLPLLDFLRTHGAVVE